MAETRTPLPCALRAGARGSVHESPAAEWRMRPIPHLYIWSIGHLEGKVSSSVGDPYSTSSMTYGVGLDVWTKRAVTALIDVGLVSTLTANCILPPPTPAISARALHASRSVWNASTSCRGSPSRARYSFHGKPVLTPRPDPCGHPRSCRLRGSRSLPASGNA